MHKGMLTTLRKQAAGLSLLFLISAVGLPAVHQVLHALQVQPVVCAAGEGLYEATDCKHLPDPCRLYASLRSLPAISLSLSALWVQGEEIVLVKAQAIFFLLSFPYSTRAPPV